MVDFPCSKREKFTPVWSPLAHACGEGIPKISPEVITEGACRTPRDDHTVPAKNSGWTVRKNAAYSAARSWSYVHEPSAFDPQRPSMLLSTESTKS
jgi:hypothetical protein